MHDGHLPAIASLGGLIIAAMGLLWHVMRGWRADAEAARKEQATGIKSIADSLHSHIEQDARLHGAMTEKLASHEKRLDRLDDVA